MLTVCMCVLLMYIYSSIFLKAHRNPSATFHSYVYAAHIEHHLTPSYDASTTKSTTAAVSEPIAKANKIYQFCIAKFGTKNELLLLKSVARTATCVLYTFHASVHSL